jgi:Pro-kumamolisin, activation domain/Subtilase family
MVAMAVLGRPAAAAPSLTRLSRLGPTPPPRGARLLGPLSRTQRVDLDVVLPPSHPQQLTALLHGLYSAGSPEYHQWLTPAQFGQDFDPAAGTVAQVVAWLAGDGLTATYRSGFGVRVSGPANTVESALGLALDDYQLHAGERAYRADVAPLVPSALSGDVVGILGLDDVPQISPQLGAASSSPAASALPRADGQAPCGQAEAEADVERSYTPDQVGSDYDIGALIGDGQSGQGQTVALFELAPHAAGDVTSYEQCFGLGNAVDTVLVDGGGTSSTSGTSEADADIEQVATQAPGASMVSYEGPDTGLGQYDTWNTIVTQNIASVVSTSWGLCEPLADEGGVMAADDVLFEQAASQGQTILAASGDSGSEDCYDSNSSTNLEVDFPGSDPWVTDVGGTELLSLGDELAWKNSGGGVSRYMSLPSWQPADWEWPNTANACGSSCRNVPDVSANAGVGEVFFTNGQWGAFVGTSLAAPLVGALVADVDSGCVTTRLGDLSPALYGLYQDGTYRSAFTDVTQGDNDFTGTYGGALYPATTGYDAVTGIGSPLAAGWSCPEVSSITSLDASSGSEVTIFGLGLETASIFFGGTPAQVVNATATSATVVVPAGSGTVDVAATSVMGEGTATSLFSYPAAPVVSSVSASGYDLVGDDGGVFVFPTGQGSGFYGSLPASGVHVHDITGMVPSPDERGYFLVGRDGGVFAFGDAPYEGSLPGLGVAVDDIQGIVPTSDNAGYFLVGKDGGVFAFGDAAYLGSLPGEGIHVDDIIGIAPDSSDQGYWVVAANGTVYAFGNATNYGSVVDPSSPVSGIAPTHDGAGYWIVTQAGGVYPFGDAGGFRSLPLDGVTPTHPIIGLVPTSDGDGYWLIGSDGGIFAFGDAPFVGSLPGLGIAISDIVGAVPTTL